jgi:hypothetical protein
MKPHQQSNVCAIAVDGQMRTVLTAIKTNGTNFLFIPMKSSPSRERPMLRRKDDIIVYDMDKYNTPTTQPIVPMVAVALIEV